MAQTISISPFTRIEGHLAVHAETEHVTEKGSSKYRVTEARCEGEMFRGFESILTGRDPLDAQQVTQRICGVCPVSHGIASIRAQEMAYGIKPSHNGRLLQNLILAANYLQSHVLHFYHLAALDFVDVTAVLDYSGNDPTLNKLKVWVEQAVAAKDTLRVAPFFPRYETGYLEDKAVNAELVGHYVQALDVRRMCHEMGAVFGARLPHATAIVPGGCTQTPTMERILAYASRLKKIDAFIRHVYVPDLLKVAKAFSQYCEIGGGCGNFLSYGVFEMDDAGGKYFRPGTVIDGKWAPLDVEAISEDVGYSRFASASGLHPKQGETRPDPKKPGAYSWLKAPRYRGRVMEVGPLARVVVNYFDPDKTWIKREVDSFLASVNLEVGQLISVLGRHAARGLEAMWVARQALRWLDEIEIDAPPARDFVIPEKAQGYGLTEAPRGALGHWLSIEDHRIKNYQCVVPTTWNCSPKDDKGQPGAAEQAIVGTDVADPEQPIEVARIVRSFDPCIACAVH